MAKKLTRRQLRAPDKFEQTTTGWLAWAREHPRETGIYAGGLILALAVIGFLFGGGEIRVDPKAGGALSAALSIVDRPVGEDADPEEKPFASTEEKQEALADAFSRVRADFAGKPSARTATLALADIRFAAGRFGDALALYEEFLDNAPQGHAMRFLALEGRALSLEGEGKLADALAGFDRLEAETPEHKARALYGKARLFERQEQWDEARAAWQTIQDDHGTSAVGREANSRLARLNLLHPKAQDAKTEG